MPDFNEQPNLRFLDDHQKHLGELWEASRKKWDETFKFYGLAFNVWSTDVQAHRRGNYRPPTARTIIDHTADQYQALVPTVRREPRNRDIDDQVVAADRAEVAMRTIMMDAAMHAMVNPWRLLGKHLNAFGYGVIEMDLVGLAPNMRSQRGRPGFWNPVRLEATNPGHVLIDPTEKVPNAAIKIVEMSAQDVLALLKSKGRLANVGEFDMKNRDPWEMVKIVRHWTGQNGWLTVRELGSTEILYQQRNSWGFIPFTHAFAGYGMAPPDMESNDPKYMADGLLDPLKETLRIQAQGETAKHTMVIEQAYPPYGTTRDREDFVKALDQEGVLEGSALDYWKLQVQEVSQWMFRSGTEIADHIERSVGSSARGGVRQPGVQTVGQQAQLDNMGRRKFIGSSMQEEHMASIAAGWIARVVDKLPTLKEGIGAHGKLLRKSDIGGDYEFDVTFEVMDPVMEDIRRRSFREEYSMGLIDDETYWNLTGVQNITERRLRLNRQRVRNSLAVLARTAQVTAQGMDELTDEDADAVFDEALEGNLPLVAQNGAGGGGAGAGLEEPRQPLDGATAKPQRLDDLAQL
jgi:hypothetical protein